MKKCISILLLLALLASCFSSCSAGIRALDPNDYASMASIENTSYSAQAAWNGSASDTSWYTANPDAAVFYLADGADLKGFVDLVYAASDPVNFAGKTVKLKNSINLGGKAWSIPSVDSYFAGTFDGDGYTVGSFTMTCTTGNQSLLGSIGGSAAVKNLNVKDATVTLKASADTTNAGLVIANVKTVTGQTVAIEDVYAKGSISDSSSKTYVCVGGIIGAIEGNGTVCVSGCVFEGSVSAKNSKVGGVIGCIKDSPTAKIANCTNRASVTAKEQLGGIVGMFSAYSGNATFESCSNTGNITVLSSSNAGQAGGMVGRYEASAGDLIFSNCTNTGKLTYSGSAGGGSWIGGIGGYLVGTGGTINSVTLTNCNSTGDILANRTSAGLVGFVQTCKTLTATDCWVNADLTYHVNSTKNPYVGGLFGMINLGSLSQMSSRTATITNCSVTGTLTTKDVTSNASYTGGLIGGLRTTTVNTANCYIDLEFFKEACEEDDVINVTLGFNQDNTSVLNPTDLTYYHYNTVPTPEDYLTFANETAVIKRVGSQYRVNAGADGVTGSADDTYDLRYVFGVRNLSDAEKAIGFEVKFLTLGEKVTTKTQTIFCSKIYKSISSETGTISAASCNADYLFTLVISGVPAKEIETIEQNGHIQAYIKSTLMDIVPFTMESAESERKAGDSIIGHGLTPEQHVFQMKHFSPFLPEAFEGATGIMTAKGVSYSPAHNLECQNYKQMKTNDQYALQKDCDCKENCEWSAHGTTAYRLNENVPYHYYIDQGSYKTYYGEDLERYEAYHTWSFEVAEDGYYEFCFRIRLNGNDGSVQNRYALVQIDDESYGSQTEFYYSITARDGTLRDNATNNDSYIVGYGKELTGGKHTITFRLPYDETGVSKASSFHFRDVYLIKGAAVPGEAEIPTLDGATLYDGNFDNNATYVLGNTSYQTYLAYVNKLEAAGFTLKESRTTAYEYLEFDAPNYKEGGDNTRENHFRTYVNEDYMVHAYFCEGPKNIRVVVAPIEAYNDYAAVQSAAKEEYEAVTTPLFASLDIGAYSNQGFCFVYRLSDGRFILVDGGQWHDDKPLDDIYKLYDWLKAHADYDGDGNYENNKITIAAWLITHLHSDHMNVAWKFEDLFGDEVEIQNYMYNFPSYEYARSVPGSNLKVDYYTVRYPMMHKLMKENNTLVVHTGMVYEFADCSIEILQTHEDFYPNYISSFNNSSTVYKITLAGKSFLVAGDLEEPGQKVCNKQAGTLLDCDFLQITHHGHNGQIEFYKYIVNEEFEDTVILWTLPKKENTSQYNKPANKWIKENLKHIHFAFENREYDLSE